jgi:hypothetical protein
MRVNLAQLGNNELISYVNDQISQYEAEKEQGKLTGSQIYNGVSLSDFQQFEKQLQRCLMFQTAGAEETSAKVKSILKEDAGISDRQYTSDNSLYEYYKKTGQVNRFFDVSR